MKNTNSFTNSLSWRFATKDFDTNYVLPEEKLEKILESVRLAPSSFGLQPYHIVVVSNKKIKKQLKDSSYNQNQIVNCSHLLVFCANTNTQKRAGEYIKVASQNLNLVQKTKLKGFEAMVRGYFSTKDKQFELNWATNQAYIALGFALAAAAELKVDSCAMEGFNNNKFDKILNLEKDTKSVCLLALGKRLNDPTRPKVRFSKEELFTHIN